MQSRNRSCPPFHRSVSRSSLDKRLLRCPGPGWKEFRKWKPEPAPSDVPALTSASPPFSAPRPLPSCTFAETGAGLVHLEVRRQRWTLEGAGWRLAGKSNLLTRLILSTGRRTFIPPASGANPAAADPRRVASPLAGGAEKRSLPAPPTQNREGRERRPPALYRRQAGISYQLSWERRPTAAVLPVPFARRKASAPPLTPIEAPRLPLFGTWEEFRS